MAGSLKHVGVVRVRSGSRATERDSAATEEPLQVRLHGRPFAVIMRTPGADCDLAAGFLLSEGVIRPGDVLELSPDPDLGVIDAVLRGSAALGVGKHLAGRRQVVGNSSCGMCGRLSAESLRAGIPAVTSRLSVSSEVVEKLPATLRAAQSIFEETGGLHAAALFDAGGRVDGCAEDVGRHNAVDKVVGRMFLGGRLPVHDRLLFVSGRTSFEIVQKAAIAGVPVVASVSAPSTLAIDLARDTGVTLLGFVRGNAFNIYTYPERVT